MQQKTLIPQLIRDEHGNYRAVGDITDDTIIDAAQRILETRFMRSGDVLTSPDATRSYLTAKLAPAQREIFATVFLDNRHRVLAYEELFFGTIDGASVHPREVVKAALTHNAAAVIFAHNHPSGVAEPSRADEQITNRLRDALQLIDVRTLDHLIVGGCDIVSFAERGLI